MSVRMRALVTVQPVLYVPGWSTASTVRPALVVVPRISARNHSQVRGGVPAQLPLMKLNRRCSIGFGLIVLGTRDAEPGAVGPGELSAACLSDALMVVKPIR